MFTMKKLFVLLTIVLLLCCAFSSDYSTKERNYNRSFNSVVANLYAATRVNPGVMQKATWKQYIFYAKLLTYEQAYSAGYGWEAELELHITTVGIATYRQQPNKKLFNKLLSSMPDCRNLYNLRTEDKGKYHYIWAETSHYGGLQLPGGKSCP